MQKKILKCPHPLIQKVWILITYKVPLKGSKVLTDFIDKRLQSLCHLANFAYDPLNYEHFEKLNIVEFFIDVLFFNDTDSQEFEFAMSGLANLACGKSIESFNASSL